MRAPLATVEMVRRFFDTPDGPNYSGVDEVVRRDPYRLLREELSDRWELVDMTDLNSDLSFVYFVAASDFEVTVRLSMVGPYALLLREGHFPTSVPLVETLLERDGFWMPSRSVLEAEVSIWDVLPPTPLYEFLFQFDMGIPW